MRGDDDLAVLVRAYGFELVTQNGKTAVLLGPATIVNQGYQLGFKHHLAGTVDSRLLWSDYDSFASSNQYVSLDGPGTGSYGPSSFTAATDPAQAAATVISRSIVGTTSSLVVRAGPAAGNIELNPATQVLLGGRQARLMVAQGVVQATGDLALGAGVADVPGQTVNVSVNAGDVVFLHYTVDIDMTAAGVGIGSLWIAGVQVGPQCLAGVTLGGIRNTPGSQWIYVAPATAVVNFKMRGNLTAGAGFIRAGQSILMYRVYSTK
jgi:hypothetical protein